MLEIERAYQQGENAAVNAWGRKKVRGRCVREVKQVNGEIKFEDALKYQKGWD